MFLLPLVRRDEKPERRSMRDGRYLSSLEHPVRRSHKASVGPWTLPETFGVVTVNLTTLSPVWGSNGGSSRSQPRVSPGLARPQAAVAPLGVPSPREPVHP